MPYAMGMQWACDALCDALCNGHAMGMQWCIYSSKITLCKIADKPAKMINTIYINSTIFCKDSYKNSIFYMQYVFLV